MHRSLRLRVRRFLAGALSLGILSVVAPGCAAMHDYDDVVLNRNHCDSCERSPWGLYRDMTNGCNPCLDRGPCDCKPACAPACAPACPAKSGCGCTISGAGGNCCGQAVTPARYETIVEPIQTVCGTVVRVWVPPVTEIRLRRVCVRPASKEVLVTPGATRTDVMCAEGCPARVESREVCVQGACGVERRCECVTIPATPCTTKREVCIQPPGRHVVATPAEYIEEPCLVELRPGHWIDRPVPPVVEMRSRVVCKSPERVECVRTPICDAPRAPACAPCAPASRR